MIGIALVPCYFTIPTFLLMFAVIHVLGPCWLAWRYDTKFRPRHVTLVLGDIASWLTVFNWLSLVPCLMLTWAFASRAVVLPIWVLAMIPLFTTLAASTVGGAWIYALMIDWMRSRGKIRRASRISCSEVDA